MSLTLKERLKKSVTASSKEVFLRSDFEHLGNYRHLSRALRELTGEQVLVRAGYGLYRRPPVAIEQVIGVVRARLGRRVRRHVEVDGSTVLVGSKPKKCRNAQDDLDARKLRMAELVLRKCSLSDIRKRSLANLHRWNELGVWVSAHDEWRQLLEHGTDEEVVAVMTGTDQKSNRLRQSAPYTGLLDWKILESIT
jgi:hypothetical protein